MLEQIPLLLADVPHDVQRFDQHWLFYLCCVFGTVVGALAGATASYRVQMDVFGILVCGCIAALGGGTLRDLLLSGVTNSAGVAVRVYWVTPGDVVYLYCAIGTSLLMFIITRFYTPPKGTIRVADAFAMAFFSLIGTAKAYMLGCPWVVAICMGVCTGVAGGALRDVLTGNVPYVFRPGELYATASFVGSALFIVLQYFGISYALSFSLGVAAVFLVRMAAVYLNWQLPSYRPLFHSQENGEEGWPEEQQQHPGDGADKH